MARPTKAQKTADSKSFLESEGYEVIKKDYYRCRKCGKYHPKSKFYESTNDKMDLNGLMPICKECANTLLDEYFSVFNNLEKAMMYTCEDLDVVYFEPAIEGLKTRMANALQNNKQVNGMFGIYKSSLAQNKEIIAGMRFRDSEIKQSTTGNDTEKVKEMLLSVGVGSEEEIEKKKHLELTWGEGYTESEYEYLEQRFDALTSMANVEYEVDTMLIKNICLEELELRRIRKDKGDTKKKVETIAILMRDANIRPTDIKNANADLMNDSYGKWLAVIEEHEPAEYFEDKKLFEDYDGIKKYFTKQVLRPLKNLLSNSRDFDF